MRVLLSTLLGLESFVSTELQEQGILASQIEVHDGRVYINQLNSLEKLSEAVAIANIYSRCAERVFVELIYEDIRDFDDLFSTVQNFAWESIIPKGSAFTVDRGYSRKSDLFGIPAIQGMIKKAIVRRLLLSQGKTEEDVLIENAELGHLKLHFSFMNNKFSLCVDTTGDGLHKRGYRTSAGAAPIKETLAAALVYMAKYKPFSEEALYDPFCGSGTILIEAAQMAAGIAPGMRRVFAAEDLTFIDQSVFSKVRSKAIERARQEHTEDVESPILFGSDIDEEVLEIAKENARRAGVENLIAFYPQNALQLNPKEILEQTGHEKVLVVTNPPYGERLMDERSMDILLQSFSKMFFTERGIGEHLRLTLITSELSLESILGFEADKRRKLYNGMLECTAYQYFKETGKILAKKTLAFTTVKKVGEKRQARASSSQRSENRFDDKPRFESKGRFGDKPRFESKERFDDKSRFESKGRFDDKPRFESKGRFGDKPRFESKGRFGDKPRFEEKGRFSDKPRFESKGRLGDKPRFESKGRFSDKPRFEEKGRFGDKPRFTSANYDVKAQREARKQSAVTARGTASKGAFLARNKKPKGF